MRPGLSHLSACKISPVHIPCPSSTSCHRLRQHHHCHFYHHLFWTQHICHKWIYPRVKCLIWNTSQLQKDALFQCFAQYVLLLHTDDRHRRGSQYLAVPPFPLIFAQDALTTSYATLAFWDLSNLRNYTCDAFWDFSNSFFLFFHLSNTFISCSKDLRVIVSLLGLLEWFELLQPHQCNSEQLTLGTQLTNKCNNYHKMECTHGLWHLCQHCENMCDDKMQLAESNVIMYLQTACVLEGGILLPFLGANVAPD